MPPSTRISGSAPPSVWRPRYEQSQSPAALALLFVDFARQSTVLVQGRAALAGPDPDWPTAPRTIAVADCRVLRAPVAGLLHLVPA